MSEFSESVSHFCRISCISLDYPLFSESIAPIEVLIRVYRKNAPIIQDGMEFMKNIVWTFFIHSLIINQNLTKFWVNFLSQSQISAGFCVYHWIILSFLNRLHPLKSWFAFIEKMPLSYRMVWNSWKILYERFSYILW